MFGFSNDFKKSFKQIKFDERFGLGAIYPSSEETELIFNCLIKKNYKIKYYPIIELFHPDDEILNKDLKKISKKFFSYGIGTGAVYAKHISKNYLFIILYLYELAKSVIGIFLSIFKLNVFLLQKHISIFNGKILGFFRFLLLKKIIKFNYIALMVNFVSPIFKNVISICCYICSQWTRVYF